MKSLKSFFENNKVKKLLAVFPHPDDESFLSGGLFTTLENMGIESYLICLSKGERGLNAKKSGNISNIRETELKTASEVLGIDHLKLWNFPDASLRETKNKWIPKLEKEIIEINPDTILTFDPSGITGHPDHITSSVETLNLVVKLKKRPLLLWRVPDFVERFYFRENGALVYSAKPNLIHKYSMKVALNKLKAIFSHGSQIKNFGFKLQMLEWHLFDHKELYFNVDLDKKYHHKFVYYKID